MPFICILLFLHSFKNITARNQAAVAPAVVHCRMHLCQSLRHRIPWSIARGRLSVRRLMMAASPAPRMDQPPPQLMSVAPMMDWTDVHYRQLARLLSRNVWLYTEMVVDSALIHNPDHDRFLWFPPEQHPISCQLGGSNPEFLAKAAAMVARYGYDEINLNCGCPSDRVAGSGCFGAALMLRPQLVAECCTAMAAAIDQTPVTVKCRLGVDDVDSYEALHRFVQIVSKNSPVTHFMIHARKCLLRGLNPAQNRSVPPLRYHWVWALKRDFPHLEFTLNGGVLKLEEVIAALNLRVDNVPGGLTGVMVGRAAYNDPWRMLGGADVAIWGETSNPATSRREVLRKYAEYADGLVEKLAKTAEEEGHGRRLPSVRVLCKPLLGMFHQEPRGKKWRAAVDEVFKTATSVSEVLERTLWVLLPETLDAPPTVPPGLGLHLENGVEHPLDVYRKVLIHLSPELPNAPANSQEVNETRTVS